MNKTASADSNNRERSRDLIKINVYKEMQEATRGP